MKIYDGLYITVAKCTFSWKGELRDTVALSIIEAAYMDIVEASKEALWLRGLVGMFGIIQDSVQVY